MLTLSTLSHHAALAAGTGNLLWTNIITIGIILVAAVAAAVSLRKS